MRRLIRPKTINGRIRLFSLVLYLSSSTVILAQSKPSTAVSRTLQTQSFPTDVKTTLKASINALQDLDYTIDVLNSDVGLITASRTTEEKKAEVSTDGVETGPAPKPMKTKAEFDAEEAAKEVVSNGTKNLGHFSTFIRDLSKNFPIQYGIISIIFAIVLGVAAAIIRRFFSNLITKTKKAS